MTKTLGVILLLVGSVILGYQAFLFTTKEKIIDTGKLTVEVTRVAPFKPYITLSGLAILVAGGVMILTRAKA